MRKRTAYTGESVTPIRGGQIGFSEKWRQNQKSENFISEILLNITKTLGEEIQLETKNLAKVSQTDSEPSMYNQTKQVLKQNKLETKQHRFG